MFKSDVEIYGSRKPRVLRTNKLLNTPMIIFHKFYKAHGVINQKIVAYILQLNGVAEKINCTIVGLVKCLLKAMNHSIIFG